MTALEEAICKLDDRGQSPIVPFWPIRTMIQASRSAE